MSISVNENAAHVDALAEAVEIMARLRAPGGCPWDREQTFDSIKRYTLEETYEVFDAIDRRAWPELKDELGDLLLQVLFYAQMADEAGHFSIRDVARGLSAKLVRRHPHVFGDAVAETAADVNATWEAVKRAEKGHQKPQRFLDEVPEHVPAMLEAAKLGKRAAKAGFDWPDAEGLFAKLTEEAGELYAEVSRVPRSQHALEDELGDLLFTVVNLARHLEIEPEFALRGANRKFRARFHAMEAAAGGIDMVRASNVDELDRMWRAAKIAAEVSGELFRDEPKAVFPAGDELLPGNSSD